MLNDIFVKNIVNSDLFKQLVNAAKTDNFVSIPEAIRTVFINELETTRSYIDRIIKQPAYDTGWMKRPPGSVPDDIEKRILKKEFSKVSNDPVEVENYINEFTIRNLDYYKFLYILGDVFAALRTLIKMRTYITDPFVQSMDYVDEYHRSFGFDIYKHIPENIRRQILSEMLKWLKKKGTVGFILQILRSLGYNNVSIYGYWLDKDLTDGLYKIFPKHLASVGTPQYVNLDDITHAVDDIEDNRWYLSNSDVNGLVASDTIWLPSKAPYISLTMGTNLADLNTLTSLLFGSIIYALTIYKDGEFPDRNIFFEGLNNYVSISELHLALAWLTTEVFSWNPAFNSLWKTLYIWNGKYQDDNGNVLPDDTLITNIINEWHSIVSTIPSSYDEKWEKLFQFRKRFLKVNTIDYNFVKYNENHSLPYVQFTDTSDGYSFIPENVVYTHDEIQFFVDSSRFGHEFVVSAIDDMDADYENNFFMPLNTNTLTKEFVHNIGVQYPIIGIYEKNYDFGAYTLTSGNVEYLTPNNLKITFTGYKKEFIVKLYNPDLDVDLLPTSSINIFLINHNLNVSYPIIQVVDIDNNILSTDYTVQIIDQDRLKIEFGPSLHDNQVKVLLKNATNYTVYPLLQNGHNTYLNVDNITNLAKDKLQAIHPELHDWVSNQIASGLGMEALNSIVDEIEIYLYDVTNIRFQFKNHFLSFSESEIRKILSWAMPYHVELLDIAVTSIIKDPIGDNIKIKSSDLFFDTTHRLWEYVYKRCRYDIGGVFKGSGWGFDKCRTPDDSVINFEFTVMLMDGLRGLRYDTGHYFDTGFIFDMSPAVGDNVNIIEVTQQLNEQIHSAQERENFVINKTINETIYEVSTMIRNNAILYIEDNNDTVDIALFEPHLTLNETGLNILQQNRHIINKILEQNIPYQDVINGIIATQVFAESIPIDDSNLSIIEIY